VKPTRKTIKCPTCRKEGDWFEGKYGPFCSHRCKLVDLGKWFGEELRISEPLRPEHLQNPEATPAGEQPGGPEGGENDQTS